MLAAFSDHQAEPGADEQSGEHAFAVPHEESEGHGAAAKIFAGIPALPKWMFYLALITAYVTPLYMMRAWWMTFMGKPRDKHVHEHAHEIALMYVPLIVLAVGTLLTGYFLVRPLIADAAPGGRRARLGHGDRRRAPHPGHQRGASLPDPRRGLCLSGWIHYRDRGYAKGLSVAEKIRKVAGPLYTLLVRKYFFDEVYNFVLVKGCILIARISRFIDTWFVDMIFNLAASITERISAFAGRIIDVHGVDGIFNGISDTSKDIGNILRKPQTGRIRNYVLFVAAVAAVLVICILVFGLQSRSVIASDVGDPITRRRTTKLVGR